MIGCLTSIGTGIPEPSDVGTPLIPLTKTLAAIATETQKTHEEFEDEMKYQGNSSLYFRFNVWHGIQNVGLDEWKETDRIEVETSEYLRRQGEKIEEWVRQMLFPQCT